MDDWNNDIAIAPEGEILETKIDDPHGARNHALLKRSGRLWFFPDGSMYVYYTPTHWRMPTSDQLETLAREVAQEAEAKAREYLNRAQALRSSKP